MIDFGLFRLRPAGERVTRHTYRRVLHSADNTTNIATTYTDNIAINSVESVHPDNQRRADTLTRVETDNHEANDAMQHYQEYSQDGQSKPSSPLSAMHIDLTA